MRKLLFLLFLLPVLLLAQDNINLSGGNYTYDMGSVEVGELSAARTQHITNNTGAPFNWVWSPYVAQASPFAYDPNAKYGTNYAVIYNGNTYECTASSCPVGTPTSDTSHYTLRVSPAKFITIAYDGDAYAATWGDGCNPAVQSVNVWTYGSWPQAPDAVCDLDVYLHAHAVGPVSGHVYLMPNDGSNPMTVITLTGIGTAVSVTGPALPRSEIYFSYTVPTACTGSVISDGPTLQSRFNLVSAGDVLCLQSGATITGNFTYPNVIGSTPVYVRTSDLSGLPPRGTRVKATDSSHLAKLQSTDGSIPVITLGPGAHDVRFVGLEITSTSPSSFLVNGPPAYTMQPTSFMNRNIVYDRMYVHTESNTQGGFGIDLNGSGGIVDSSIILAGKDETQAISICTGAGPFTFDNVEAVAVGENSMIGGCDTRVKFTVPSDITFRNIYWHKPLSWNPHCTDNTICGGVVYDGIFRAVKNLFELKKGIRVLVDGAVLEGNFNNAQDGSGILIEPANQSGSDINLQVRDVTMRKVWLRKSGQGINHVSSSYAWGSRSSKHFLFEDVLETEIGQPYLGAGMSAACIVNLSAGASSWFFRYQTNPTPGQDYTIKHFSCISDNASVLFYQSNGVLSVQNMVFKDVVSTFGNYGFYLGGNGSANASTYWNPNTIGTVKFTGGSKSQTNWTSVGWLYDTSKFSFTGTANMGFADPSNNDYRFCTGVGQPTLNCTGPSPYLTAASDGKQLGADVAAIMAIEPGIVAGTPGYNPPPPPQGVNPPSNLIVTSN